MKVCIIGGTGLLGSQAAAELIKRGHQVKAIALPPLPQGAVLPPEMEIEYGNYLEMNDEELKKMFEGCEGFVFAACVDERVEGPAPIYELYRKYNIDPVKKLLSIAKECGVKSSVICGSYFSYFAKARPQMKLTEYHPYIRSRIDQENVAMSFADDNFNVAVLELPYIFGTQPGRKPVWVFLVESIRKMPGVTMWPKGGSTMVTVKQVGQAIAGAIERNKGGNCYPIGYYNYNWKQLLNVVHKYLGEPNRKTITIPDFMYTMGGIGIEKDYKKRGIQGGLDMIKYTALQCSELFIDRKLGCDILGVEDDDIDAAIGDSVKLCLEILDGKAKDIVAMKGE